MNFQDQIEKANNTLLENTSSAVLLIGKLKVIADWLDRASQDYPRPMEHLDVHLSGASELIKGVITDIDALWDRNDFQIHIDKSDFPKVLEVVK